MSRSATLMSLPKLEPNLAIEDGPWKLKIFMVAMGFANGPND